MRVLVGVAAVSVALLAATAYVAWAEGYRGARNRGAA